MTDFRDAAYAPKMTTSSSAMLLMASPSVPGLTSSASANTLSGSTYDVLSTLWKDGVLGCEREIGSMKSAFFTFFTMHFLLNFVFKIRTVEFRRLGHCCGR